MSFVEMTQQAKEQLAQVTGLKPVLISATFKDEDGWHVFLDMLEMKRIRDSADVLGYYEVLPSDDGDMVKFKRKCSHLRCQPVEDEEVN